jgi:hypothetical protein
MGESTSLLNRNIFIKMYTEPLLRNLQCPCSLRQERDVTITFHTNRSGPLKMFGRSHPTRQTPQYSLTLRNSNLTLNFIRVFRLPHLNMMSKHWKHFADILKEAFVILKLNSMEACVCVCDFRSVSCKHSSCYKDFLLTLSRQDDIKR